MNALRDMTARTGHRIRTITCSPCFATACSATPTRTFASKAPLWFATSGRTPNYYGHGRNASAFCRIPPASEQIHSACFPALPLSRLLFPLRLLRASRIFDQAAHPAARLTSDLTGSIPVHDGDHVRLSTTLAASLSTAENSGKVDYRVHLETDAAEKDARELLKSLTIDAHPTPDGVALKAHASGHARRADFG